MFEGGGGRCGSVGEVSSVRCLVSGLRSEGGVSTSEAGGVG